MLQTRARMVSFRLSEEEYQRLKELSVSQKARSISEFARSVLCQLPAPAIDGPQSPASRLEAMEAEVEALRADLTRLKELVERIQSPFDRSPGL